MLPIGAAARIPQKPSAVNSFQRIGQQPITSLFTTLRHPTRFKSSLSPDNLTTKPSLSLESQGRADTAKSVSGGPAPDSIDPPLACSFLRLAYHSTITASKSSNQTF